MQAYRLDQTDIFQELLECAADMNRETMHLRHLISRQGRLSDFSRRGAGLFFDFSRQRIDDTTFNTLARATETLRLPDRFQRMCRGEKINVTEQRAVLHTAAL